MTERTKITLSWRPPGAPPARIDDFCEAANVSVRVELAPKRERVVERRSIGRRLENWGMWANQEPSRSGSRSDCMTGVICANMRRHAAGVIGPAAPVDDRVDIVDAERINRGITQIDEIHRWVLHWTYVVCVKPRAVAGACGFPAAEYGVRLGDAQAAIESVVGAIGSDRS